MVLPRCLVFGSLNIDEFFRVPYVVRPGETISSTGLTRRPGGNGGNQAVAVARAQGAVSFVGAVGSDGEWVVNTIADYGVDVSGVRVVDEPTGRAIIQLTDDGENCIVLFPGANHTELSRADLQPYTHILLQNEILFSATLGCLSGDQNSNSQHQKRIRIFNPSPLPDAAKVLEIPWESIDWLVVNVHEGRGLLSSLGAPGSNADGDSAAELSPAWSGLPVPPETARMLRALSMLPPLSCTNIVCTLGALGVVALIRDMHVDTKDTDAHGSYSDGPSPIPIYVPAATLQGETRDSTGAGDCFTGYFVGGLMRMWNEGASRSASRETYEGLLGECAQAAGMCVEKFGAMESMPRREEVLKRIGASSRADV